MAGGMKDWAMLIAMEMTLARENMGCCVWGGHILGCCWCVGGDKVVFSLLFGLEVSLRDLGDPGAGEGMEVKVGLLATRVRGGWTPAGLVEPGEAG